MTLPPPQYQQLHVSFPKWPGWDMRTLSMTRHSVDRTPDFVTFDCREYDDGCDCRMNGFPKSIPPNPHASDALDVVVDSASHDDYSSDSPIFHATSGTASLALKFALREDLIPALFHEAHMYTTHLERVQGQAVPWCWGFFVGTSPITGERIACLVLEYWGEALPVRFCDLHKELRMFILMKLEEIHRCGVHHGDFAERNILYSETNGVDIRIIDFDRTLVHRCQGSCEVLQQVEREMQVWG